MNDDEALKVEIETLTETIRLDGIKLAEGKTESERDTLRRHIAWCVKERRLRRTQLVGPQGVERAEEIR